MQKTYIYIFVVSFWIYRDDSSGAKHIYTGTLIWMRLRTVEKTATAMNEKCETKKAFLLLMDG